jgi:transposase
MTTTILSGPERRRRRTSEQKLQIVRESLAAGAKVAAVARRHDVHPNLIYGWRRQMRNGVLSASPAGGVQFVPVTVAAAAGNASTAAAPGLGSEPAIEVVLRNGRVLRVSDGVAPTRAAALADALEGIGR